MNILVLGAAGLLGNAIFNVFGESRRYQVAGTIRDNSIRDHFASDLLENLIVVKDLENIDNLKALLDDVTPDVVINCISLSNIGHQNPMRIMEVFAVFSQRLAHLCRQRNARLIQMGSDGVFSGNRGNYSEEDLPDAEDPYGKAKLLGEVGGLNEITIRTSIIGTNPVYKRGLIEWFLTQKDCRLHTKAIFSGFPTTVLADIIHDEIIPRSDMCGIFHLAANPISKFDLLNLVAEKYGISINIVRDDTVVIDRSLNAGKFNKITGYSPPTWPDLIDAMQARKFGKRES